MCLYYLDELIREDPNFDFSPVGVEITAVVSHNPNLDQSQEQFINLTNTF